MSAIRQGQTLSVSIETDLSSIDDASVVVRSGGKVRRIDGVTVDGSSIMFSMSSSETASLSPGKLEIQAKALTEGNMAVSNIMTETVLESIDPSGTL